MSRSIITYDYHLRDMSTLKLKAGEALPPEDKYKDRLLKYIPGEVVTLYVTLTGLAATATGLPWWIGWVIFLIGAIATWVYLRMTLHVTDVIQLVVSTLSFCVWAFALGGPFTEFAWYRPIYGALLLPTFTFFAALIKTAPQKPA